MARRPTSDERSVLPPASNAPIQERFFLKELRALLRCRGGELLRLLRREGLLRKYRPLAQRKPYWVTTKRGVQIAIAHFRARQGAKWEQGSRRRRAPKAGH